MSRTSKHRPKAKADGLPLVTLVFMVSGFLLGYLLGEILLALRPHPWHWLLGAAAMGIGYVLGQGVYRRYGDVV